MGYSTEGAMGYKLFIPDLKEIVVGVHVIFNENIPSYTDEYFNDIRKLSFETVEDASTVEAFSHLEGQTYVDDDLLKYINTRVGDWKGNIVVWRALVNEDGRRGNGKKIPDTCGRRLAHDGQ